MSLVLVLLPWEVLKIKFMLQNGDILSKYMTADEINAHSRDVVEIRGRRSWRVKERARQITGTFLSRIRKK